jgi:protocatechuate 3,4-dioxygenase beta subunit
MNGRRAARLAAAAVAAVVLIPGIGSASAESTACPNSNPPNELLLASGSGQTAQLGKPFPTNLQAQLANSNGCPLTGNLAGISVAFDAPGSGPSGTFAGSGSREAVVGADAQGIATAPAFTANDTAGSYTVEGHSDYGSVHFSLANTASGLATAISASGGTDQQATVNSQYALPLQARVTDANGNPVQAAAVSFSILPGSTGASASFPSGTQASATTGANGLATSPPLLANGSPGRFTAVASAEGLSSVATYTLANHAAVETLTAATGRAQSATIDSRYARPLTARLLDADGQPIEGASVDFTLGPQAGTGGEAAATPGAKFISGASQATALTDANGVATSPRFTANGTPGTFTATATSAGIAAPLTFVLRNLPARLVLSKRGASATVATRYRRPVVARVRDAGGKPVGDVSVTFTISSASNGASATFPDGSKQVTELTGGQGGATSPRLRANTTAGRFTITAAISGTRSLASSTLRNLAARPAMLTAGVASGESTQISQRFPVPLAVTVSDSYGNRVPDTIVTFTAPARGASGHFTIARRRGRSNKSASTTPIARVVRVRTNANGIAVAPAFTANGISGGYIVKATVRGSTARASFALVNSLQ